MIMNFIQSSSDKYTQPTIKYDVASKKMGSCMAGVKINKTPIHLTYPKTQFVGTNISNNDIQEREKEILRNQTNIYYNEYIWPSLPNLSDYLDVDSLYDPDEVMDSLISASNKLGW